MGRFYFYGVCVIILLVIGIPALKAVGDGFSKDMNNLTNMSTITSINTNQSNPIASVYPNTLNAAHGQIEKVGNGIASFFEALFTMILIGGAIALTMYIVNARKKAKEEARYSNFRL